MAKVPPFSELIAATTRTAVHLETRDLYTPDDSRFVDRSYGQFGRLFWGLTWAFTGLAGWRSGYVKVSGIRAPMSSKACRWVLVGSASIAMVTSVPVYRTWLRVSVARCSIRPRKLW